MPAAAGRPWPPDRAGILLSLRIRTMTRRHDSSSDARGRFSSKRDTWIVIVLWTAALALVYASHDVASSPTHPAFKVVFVSVCLLSAMLMPWVLYGTSYALTGDSLRIRCGPFRSQVPIRAIQEVVPSRSPVSSPACSLDRLHIKYQGSRLGVLISPTDKQSFLRELAELDSELTLQGDQIVRGA
jgi:membrane protein YdbS with pleckstrin-like domain